MNSKHQKSHPWRVNIEITIDLLIWWSRMASLLSLQESIIPINLSTITQLRDSSQQQSQALSSKITLKIGHQGLRCLILIRTIVLFPATSLLLLTWENLQEIEQQIQNLTKASAVTKRTNESLISSIKMIQFSQCQSIIRTRLRQRSSENTSSSTWTLKSTMKVPHLRWRRKINRLWVWSDKSISRTRMLLDR